jgi:hypothetical protein
VPAKRFERLIGLPAICEARFRLRLLLLQRGETGLQGVGVGAILDGARDGGELRSISANVRLAARVSRLAEVARLRISALNAPMGH